MRLRPAGEIARKTGLVTLFLIVLIASGAVAMAAPANPVIGVISVGAGTTVTIHSPGEPARQARSGEQVRMNDRLSTGAGVGAQILFTDGSTLSLGPASDIQLDEFVFDPRSGSGKLAASVSQGVLRYVGGRLSKGTKAGVLQNVTREVESTLPGGPTISLIAGQEVFPGQRIITDSTGRAEIRHPDGTTDKLAPNSDVTIGEPTLSIKTPTTSIGIRG